MLPNIENLLQKVALPAAKGRIVVAMSGGVDSSVVAALLSYFGYETIGVTLQLYDHGAQLAKKGACCAGQDIYDASLAAETIGIPHYVLNYESIFREAVMDNFADSYLQGETPIPCVKCNQSVKFRDLFKMAKDLDAIGLATGHYVQKKFINGSPQMHKGFDPKKDQSYFLFTTTPTQLDFVEFPLGGLTKEETRQLAKYFNLKIAEKPDSQDICFVPNGDYRSIVEKLRPYALDRGDIIDTTGNKLGEHDGIINFTVGQRKKIGVTSKEPLYVIKIDHISNTVVVGPKSALYQDEVYIKECNWLNNAVAGQSFDCIVKLRSQQQEAGATVSILPDNRAHLRLHTPYLGVSPGQAAVCYHDSQLLGGGWITRQKT